MVLDVSVNWMAVVLSAVAGFIVSWIWWGPLFGKSWARLSGMKPNKNMKKGMGSKMVIALIAQLIMAYVLAVLVTATGTVGVGAALMLSLWLWLGFVASIGVGMVLWMGKPWGLFWLNMIGWLVTIWVMAIILALMG